MPGKPKPVIFLNDKLKKFIDSRYYWWGRPRPFYIAVGLLMLAVMVMLVITVGMENDLKSKTPPMIPAGLPVEEATKSLETIKLEQSGNSGGAGVAPAASETATSKSEDIISKVEHAPEPAPSISSGEVTLGFGWQLHPLYKDWRYHDGIDITCVAGVRVKAVMDGEVQEVYTDVGSGLTVVVAGGGYTVYYGSLSEAAVSQGDYIRVGNEIGAAGTCRAEPYPHLHLAVKYGDKYLNPHELVK